MATSSQPEGAAAGENTPASRQIRRIVVGIDGSETAKLALRFAADEARTRGASLHVVHVYQSMVTAYPYQTLDGGALRQQVEEEARQAAEGTLAEQVAGVPELAGLDVDREVRQGRPSAEILDAGAEADLIVLGTRGLGGFRGMLLGSVGQHVVAHAHVPVVLVPVGE